MANLYEAEHKNESGQVMRKKICADTYTQAIEGLTQSGVSEGDVRYISCIGQGVDIIFANAETLSAELSEKISINIDTLNSI